jgi:hypothetical protein
MRVNHRRLHVLVAKQFLNGSDVIAVLEQVRRKRAAQGVTGGVSADSRRDGGVSNRGGSGRGEGPGLGAGAEGVGRDTAPVGRVCGRGPRVACRVGRDACASFIV